MSEIERAESGLWRGIGYGLLVSVTLVAVVAMLLVAVGMAS